MKVITIISLFCLAEGSAVAEDSKWVGYASNVVGDKIQETNVDKPTMGERGFKEAAKGGLTEDAQSAFDELVRMDNEKYQAETKRNQEKAEASQVDSGSHASALMLQQLARSAAELDKVVKNNIAVMKTRWQDRPKDFKEYTFEDLESAETAFKKYVISTGKVTGDQLKIEHPATFMDQANRYNQVALSDEYATYLQGNPVIGKQEYRHHGKPLKGALLQTGEATDAATEAQLVSQLANDLRTETREASALQRLALALKGKLGAAAQEAVKLQLALQVDGGESQKSAMKLQGAYDAYDQEDEELEVDEEAEEEKREQEEQAAWQKRFLESEEEDRTRQKERWGVEDTPKAALLSTEAASTPAMEDTSSKAQRIRWVEANSLLEKDLAHLNTKLAVKERLLKRLVAKKKKDEKKTAPAVAPAATAGKTDMAANMKRLFEAGHSKPTKDTEQDEALQKVIEQNDAQYMSTPRFKSTDDTEKGFAMLKERLDKQDVMMTKLLQIERSQDHATVSTKLFDTKTLNTVTSPLVISALAQSKMYAAQVQADQESMKDLKEIWSKAYASHTAAKTQEKLDMMKVQKADFHTQVQSESAHMFGLD